MTHLEKLNKSIELLQIQRSAAQASNKIAEFLSEFGENIEWQDVKIINEASSALSKYVWGNPLEAGKLLNEVKDKLKEIA